MGIILQKTSSTYCYNHRSSESNILPSFDPETVLQTGECRSVLSVIICFEFAKLPLDVSEIFWVHLKTSYKSRFWFGNFNCYAIIQHVMSMVKLFFQLACDSSFIGGVERGTLLQCCYFTVLYLKLKLVCKVNFIKYILYNKTFNLRCFKVELKCN